jgi:hypothetical protein
MTRIQTASNSPVKSQAVLVSTQHDLTDTTRHSKVRLTVQELFSASSPEEVLVVEERAHLRPAQVVETKLARLLQGAAFPVSHLQMRGLLTTR